LLCRANVFTVKLTEPLVPGATTTMLVCLGRFLRLTSTLHRTGSLRTTTCQFNRKYAYVARFWKLVYHKIFVVLAPDWRFEVLKLPCIWSMVPWYRKLVRRNNALMVAPPDREFGNRFALPIRRQRVGILRGPDWPALVFPCRLSR
jgi:hypothetical protein